MSPRPSGLFLRPLHLLAALLATANVAMALEFRALGWGAPIEGLCYETGGKTIPLLVLESGLSPVYRLDPAAPLSIFREELRDGHPIRIPVATLAPPPSLEKAILVLAPTRDGHCEGHWLDDSPEARPVNHLKFFNLSRSSVAVKIRSAELRLSPGADASPVPFDLAARSVPMIVAVYSGTGWQIASTEPQAVRAGLSILILLRDGRNDSDGTDSLINLVRLYEHPAP